MHNYLPLFHFISLSQGLKVIKQLFYLFFWKHFNISDFYFSPVILNQSTYGVKWFTYLFFLTLLLFWRSLLFPCSKMLNFVLWLLVQCKFLISEGKSQQIECTCFEVNAFFRLYTAPVRLDANMKEASVNPVLLSMLHGLVFGTPTIVIWSRHYYFQFKSKETDEQKVTCPLSPRYTQLQSQCSCPSSYTTWLEMHPKITPESSYKAHFVCWPDAPSCYG